MKCLFRVAADLFGVVPPSDSWRKREWLNRTPTPPSNFLRHCRQSFPFLTVHQPPPSAAAPVGCVPAFADLLQLRSSPARLCEGGGCSRVAMGWWGCRRAEGPVKHESFWISSPPQCNDVRRYDALLEHLFVASCRGCCRAAAGGPSDTRLPASGFNPPLMLRRCDASLCVKRHSDTPSRINLSSAPAAWCSSSLLSEGGGLKSCQKRLQLAAVRQGRLIAEQSGLLRSSGRVPSRVNNIDHLAFLMKQGKNINIVGLCHAMIDNWASVLPRPPPGPPPAPPWLPPHPATGRVGHEVIRGTTHLLYPEDWAWDHQSRTAIPPPRARDGVLDQGPERLEHAGSGNCSTDVPATPEPVRRV